MAGRVGRQRLYDEPFKGAGVVGLTGQAVAPRGPKAGVAQHLGDQDNIYAVPREGGGGSVTGDVRRERQPGVGGDPP